MPEIPLTEAKNSFDQQQFAKQTANTLANRKTYFGRVALASFIISGSLGLVHKLDAYSDSPIDECPHILDSRDEFEPGFDLSQTVHMSDDAQLELLIKTVPVSIPERSHRLHGRSYIKVDYMDVNIANHADQVIKGLSHFPKSMLDNCPPDEINFYQEITSNGGIEPAATYNSATSNIALEIPETINEDLTQETLIVHEVAHHFENWLAHSDMKKALENDFIRINQRNYLGSKHGELDFTDRNLALPSPNQVYASSYGASNFSEDLATLFVNLYLERGLIQEMDQEYGSPYFYKQRRIVNLLEAIYPGTKQYLIDRTKGFRQSAVNQGMDLPMTYHQHGPEPAEPKIDDYLANATQIYGAIFEAELNYRNFVVINPFIVEEDGHIKGFFRQLGPNLVFTPYDPYIVSIKAYDDLKFVKGAANLKYNTNHGTSELSINGSKTASLYYTESENEFIDHLNISIINKSRPIE